MLLPVVTSGDRRCSSSALMALTPLTGQNLALLPQAPAGTLALPHAAQAAGATAVAASAAHNGQALAPTTTLLVTASSVASTSSSWGTECRLQLAKPYAGDNYLMNHVRVKKGAPDISDVVHGLNRLAGRNDRQVHPAPANDVIQLQTDIASQIFTFELISAAEAAQAALGPILHAHTDGAGVINNPRHAALQHTVISSNEFEYTRTQNPLVTANLDGSTLMGQVEFTMAYDKMHTGHEIAHPSPDQFLAGLRVVHHRAI